MPLWAICPKELVSPVSLTQFSYQFRFCSWFEGISLVQKPGSEQQKESNWERESVKKVAFALLAFGVAWEKISDMRLKRVGSKGETGNS